MRVPTQAPPVARNRFARAAGGGIRPQGCNSTQTLCSCPFLSTCCNSGSTCTCPFGWPACN